MLGKIYDQEGVTKTMDSTTTHVLLRASESQADGLDTVAEHRLALKAHGSVVWAKIGKPIADQRVSELNAQIDAGDATHAYLLASSPTRLFRANVTRINQGLASIDQEAVPEPYRETLSGNETCLTLSQIEEVDLFPQIDSLLYLESNPDKKMTEALFSTTSVFFVKERQPDAKKSAGIGSSDPRIEAAAQDLNMTVAEVVKLLNGVNGQKRQMILMGPPGTGKTFVALKLAELLTENSSNVRLIQFHPSYGYEDFIEGLRPVAGDQGGFEFERVPGVLVEMVDAIERDGQTRVLIIDEINRANMPRVFGELMFLLEYRDRSMRLMLSNREFRLPEQLIIIGTMNTADRSIRSLDVAMRRRFRFFELLPRPDVIQGQYSKPGWSNSLGARLVAGFTNLNQKLKEDIDRHHTIGHSYFLQKNMSDVVLGNIWEQEILPLIEDYFFDRPDKVDEYSFSNFWPHG